MDSRTTATSKTIEYNTDTCIHCNDEVFIDEKVENVDGLPRGIHVIIGGGEHLSTEATPRTARKKKYRTPKRVIKWFMGDGREDAIDKQYMCPPCANSVYGFQDNR